MNMIRTITRTIERKTSALILLTLMAIACAVALVSAAAPPTITSVTPASGPAGTVVTITGTNFVTDLLVGKIGAWGPFQQSVPPANQVIGKPAGSYVGTPVFTADGGGAITSSETSYVNVADGGAGGTYDWTTGGWSMQVDFTFPTAPVFPAGGAFLLASKGSFALGTGWELEINPAAFQGKYQIELEVNHGVNSYDLVTAYLITPGAFHRALVVCDGAGHGTWYVNGTAWATQVCNPPTSAATDVTIGRYSAGTGYAANFPISRVQVWNRALTAAEAVQSTTGDPAPSTVRFNTTPALPTAWTPTSITAAVPAGATTGNVTVAVNGQTSNGVPFTVTTAAPAPPTVDKTLFADGSGTRTTAAFSTTAPEVLVAFVGADGPLGQAQTATVSGAGLTWTLAKRANGQAGTAEIWTATALAPLTNVTVTSTEGLGGFYQSLTVVTFTGSSGIGATAGASAATGATSVTLTATQAASVVYGIGEDWDSAQARTLGAGQALVHQYLPPSGDTMWVQNRTGATAAAGTLVTLNDTAPTTDRWNFAAIEILDGPVGGQTQMLAQQQSGQSGGTTQPGGTILVVTSAANPFTQYYTEILRAEGLNEFSVADITTVTASTLAGYDVAILGEQTLTTSQTTMFTDWVTGGGNLIAMRPDSKLASLLGLTRQTGSNSNGYLLIDTSTAPGAGLVAETIQFHGTADRYFASAATVLATIYGSATQATPYPAVTVNAVGTNGGHAAAFAFDLARSIVYTRQGNPAWAGQERDGVGPIRPDDLFFGARTGDVQPDWIDLNKAVIPQADEQQRLLANLILQINGTHKPLPRFWYLPRGLKAVVLMTGEDHGNGGTAGRFAQYQAASPAGCVVDNWQCVRGTSYLYPSTPLSNAQLAGFAAQGFEVGLHVTMDPATMSGCGNNFTAATLTAAYTTQLAQFAAAWPSLPPPATHRMHCQMWSDWSSQPATEALKGIGLDTNYCYSPGSWINNRPGMFTGSGMPMRFAALDGSLINVYQAAVQMTDDSNQTYPFNVDTLLDNALGANGYYGVFAASMQTDAGASAGSDAILGSALARGVPIVSAKQMLTWLDGRNGSAFNGIAWAGNTLTFSVDVAAGATGLQVMIPTHVGTLSFTGATLNNTPVTPTIQTIKGIEYAIVTAAAGQYRMTYVP